MRKNKKQSKLFILILLILGISLGYALLSSTLSIMGTAGINKNTWDIHWNENSIVETPGSVTAKTPAYVSNDEKTIVTFDTELELPGDFYEFTVDAKNYGTIDGQVKKVTLKFLDPKTDEVMDIDDLPEYLTYTFTHGDGTEIIENEAIDMGESIKYKFRLEFNEDATAIPTPEDGEEEIPTPKPIIELETIQKVKTYTVNFNANGGVVEPISKTINQGDVIGELPVPNKGLYPFLGWYTEETEGTLINENTVPTGNVTYYAHWDSSVAIFDTGKNVNIKFKRLAGNSVYGEEPWQISDTRIENIYKSETAPDINSMTDANVVSVEESPTPIYAWYDNYNIYWWSDAESVYLNEDASYMFNRITEVENINTSFITSNTTDMSYLFGSCNDLRSIDLSGFNTSKVTNMSNMFLQNYQLQNINVSNFDTSSVTDMSGMFTLCNKLTTLDLSNFDTTNVTNMTAMLYGVSSLTTLNMSNFNFSNYNPGSLMMNISSGGFNSLRTLKFDNVVCPQNMVYAFGGLPTITTFSFNNIDTSNVTNMEAMFMGDKMTSLDLSSFITNKVTTMNTMFQNCNNLQTLNLESFVTNNVTTMDQMFYGCSSLTTISVSDDFVVDQVTSSNGMFGGDTNLVGGNGTEYDSNHIDKEYAHYDYSSNNPGYFNRRDMNGKYKITLKDGNDTLRSFYITQGDEIGEIASIYKTGYSFDGWYTKNEGGDKVLSSYVPSSDMTLYARFILGSNDYVLVFNANGGSVSPQSKTVPRNSKVGVLPIPVKYGYSFVGWYTGLTEGVEVTQDYVLDSNKTIYAHWTEKSEYTVTFNGNGGTPSFASKTVYDGDQIQNLPGATREGYNFVGWYTGETDGVKIDSSYVVDKTQTLWAHWTAKEVYTITFNPNGGTVEETTREVYEGGSIGDFPTATRSGYAVDYWYLGVTDGTKVTSSYIPTSDITITVKWKVDFENDSWDTISTIAKEGNYCADFKVGDTKEVDMGTYGVHTLRISNCTYSATYDQTGYSQSANGIVIEFADGIVEHEMNPYTSGTTQETTGVGANGGWALSSMRTFVNNDIYNALPSDLQSVIINTRVRSGMGYYDSFQNCVTTDKLYLLADKEVFGNTIDDQGQLDRTNNTRMLDYYSIGYQETGRHEWNTHAIKRNKVMVDGLTRYKDLLWWLRNVHTNPASTGKSGDSNYRNGLYGLVNSDTTSSGKALYGSATTDAQHWVSPAFRIG